jgi:hypothetical protein
MQLRDYQTDIANKALALLQTYKIAYLSMQVRTGKTITALFTAELYGAKHVLFITKKKAIRSIEDDSEKLAVTYLLAVINYEQLHKFDNEGFDLIIVDEAHSLGQFPIPSERTKLLKNIAAGLPIIYLSGTPSPESFSQLFHQFFVSSFSPFAAYVSFYKWAKDYVQLKKKYLYNREINDYSNADKQKIDEATNHLFISYTQAEAGFEQVIEEEVLTVKMKPGTYWLADRLRKDKVYIGRDGQELLGDTAVKLMNKLHQIYSGTCLFEDGSSNCFDHSKAEFIRDRFAGKKIAVFYKFKAEKEMLNWVFRCKVTEVPEEFATSDSLVFISQIQSGREGINLSTAEALIFLNIDFSYLSYEQGKNRLQSKDRVMAAKVYWIFSDGGIEQKIYERVQNKSDYTTAHYRKDYERSTNPERSNKAPGAIGVASS